jgi:hypothetical protein
MFKNSRSNCSALELFCGCQRVFAVNQMELMINHNLGIFNRNGQSGCGTPAPCKMDGSYCLTLLIKDNG